MIPKPVAAAGRFTQRLLRTPGGTGVVIAAITIPLMLVWRAAAPFIARAALVSCPFLDTPRTLAGMVARRSGRCSSGRSWSPCSAGWSKRLSHSASQFTNAMGARTPWTAHRK